MYVYVHVASCGFLTPCSKPFLGSLLFCEKTRVFRQAAVSRFYYFSIFNNYGNYNAKPEQGSCSGFACNLSQGDLVASRNFESLSRNLLMMYRMPSLYFLCFTKEK